MATTMKLEIVTPEALSFSGDVEMVTIPAAEGEMGVYPLHVPLMTQMVAGELVARINGRDQLLAVGEGFVQITGDKVSVMTDMAIKADEIDEARVEEARRMAEARLSETLDSEESAMVSAALARSLAQLKVKRHHRH